MYCPPHLMCVPTLPRRNECSNFHVFNNWYWFYFHKAVFALKPNFHIFAKIYQKKMFTKCMLQFGIIPTSELVYHITNHATDAIQAIVHTVNMQFRKLKKKNVRNTNKTWQLIQDSQRQVLELSSACIHAGVQRRDREQKSFMEIKLVLINM